MIPRPVIKVSKFPQSRGRALLMPAALGRLGRGKEEAQALAELLHLRPDFPTAGPFLMSCYVKFPSLVDGLMEGLRLAGLKT